MDKQLKRHEVEVTSVSDAQGEIYSIVRDNGFLWFFNTEDDLDLCSRAVFQHAKHNGGTIRKSLIMTMIRNYAAAV